MKKLRNLVLLVIVLTKFHDVNAQVGVNTETPKVTLDITKMKNPAADGILIPRLTVQDLIDRHVASMYGIDQHSTLVYVTDITKASTTTQTQKITKEGFYYYNYTNTDDKWLPLESAGSIWNKVTTTLPSEYNTDNSYLTAKVVIGGNTIASINGGTDNAQLTVVGEDISVQGVTVGTGKGGNSMNSVLGKDALVSNTDGVLHVAVGFEALKAQEKGYGNVAVGAYASTAVGTEIMGITSLGAMSNAAANYSTVVGANSVVGENSDKSTALGYYSTIEKNASGSIAIGEGAKIAENASLGIAIGKQTIVESPNSIAIGAEASLNKNDYTFIKNKSTTIGTAVNTSNVTLEIVGERENENKADGILIPNVSLSELNAKNNKYAEPQFGTLVFVNYINDTPSGKTEDVTSYGFYYYNYWHGRGERWTKLNDVPLRRTTVEVGSGKNYANLQEAFNEEAKKMYNQNGAPVEFVCSGDVGGLDTDGSIPYIKITSDGTMIVSGKNLTFNNTIAHFSGKIDFGDKNLTAYGSDLVVAQDAEIIANQLAMDNSSFKAFFGGNNLTFGAITCYSGFIDIEGNTSKPTNLTLVGDSDVKYLVSATNGGYILFANDLNIKCNSTSSQDYGFSASKSGIIYCNKVTNIEFNNSYGAGESYDIYANGVSSILFEMCKNIGGNSTPSIFIGGAYKSNIVCYQSKVNKTVKDKGVYLISGSSFNVIGDQTSIVLDGNGIGSEGILSSGSDVNLSNITTSAPMVTLKNFTNGLNALDGGIVNAMGRIDRVGCTNPERLGITIGTTSRTGSVIYDSDVE